MSFLICEICGYWGQSIELSSLAQRVHEPHIAQTINMRSNDFKPLFLASISLWNTKLEFFIYLSLPPCFPPCTHHSMLLPGLPTQRSIVCLPHWDAHCPEAGTPLSCLPFGLWMAMESLVLGGDEIVSRECPLHI